MAEPATRAPGPPASAARTADADATGAPHRWTDPGAAFERRWLDRTSWVDVARGWLRDADDVYRSVRDELDWQPRTMWRYERYVTEPRLTTFVPRGKLSGFPALTEAYRTLRARYGVEFDGFGMSYYRDGRDSVAYHRDREMRWLDDTLIAILTLGARRPWMVKSRHLPRTARILTEDRGDGIDLAPGPGDLLVLGGRAQADWLHAVPRVSNVVGGRISVQMRWTSRTGQPEIGPGYGAPRQFTR